MYFNINNCSRKLATMKTNIGNGIELLHSVMLKVAQTAPRHTLRRNNDDVLLFLESGQLEGNALALAKDQSSVTLFFFHTHASAIHRINGARAFFELQLYLGSTNITDPKYGKLFEQVFTLSNENLLRQAGSGTKILPHIGNFISLLDTLPCNHVWEAELTSSWAMIMSEATTPAQALAKK